MTRNSPPLRLLFVPGPGAVHETYLFWHNGNEDIWNPAVPYSEQVYDITHQIDCDMLVLSEDPVPKSTSGRIRFIYYKARGGHGPMFHVNELIYAFGLVAKAIRHRSDAVIIQRQPAHFWPLALLPWLGIQIYASFHNTFWTAGQSPSRRTRFYMRANRPFFRACTLLLCVSEVVKQQVLSTTGPDQADKIAVHIPQYAEKMRGQWRQVAANHKLRNLLYLGRIEADKGVFLLLEAFEVLCTRFPNLQLVFVGPGNDLAILQDRIGRSPVADRITATGRTDGAGVYASLIAADILICPTTSRFSEGLAKTPIEATLCGVPSIVTTNVPVGAILGDSVIIVAPDDAHAIVTAVTDLIQSPSLYRKMARATKNQRSQFFDRRLSFGQILLDALRDLIR